MKRLPSILCGACLALITWANAPAEYAYLHKFMNYLHYAAHLPLKDPEPAFINTIQEQTPLSNKLREKWLSHLARNQQWALYHDYYQTSEDQRLQCHHVRALLETHHLDQAWQEGQVNWITGHELPSACDGVFQQFLDENKLTDALIDERIKVALEHRNIALAKYLVTLKSETDHHEKKLLDIVHRQPTRITTLSESNLHGHMFLYGLKRLVIKNPKKAIEIWKQERTQNVLTQYQKQSFIAHMALYKAIRDRSDTKEWFQKVEPSHYDTPLLEWQTRFALRHRDWAMVQSLPPIGSLPQLP